MDLDRSISTLRRLFIASLCRLSNAGLALIFSFSRSLAFCPATLASGFFTASERASDTYEAKIAGTAARIEQ